MASPMNRRHWGQASCADLAGQLDRFVRPRLGNMIASEVTNRDIAQLRASHCAESCASDQIGSSLAE